MTTAARKRYSTYNEQFSSSGKSCKAGELQKGDTFRCNSTLFGRVTAVNRCRKNVPAGSYNGGVWFIQLSIDGKEGKELCMGRDTDVRRISRRRFQTWVKYRLAALAEASGHEFKK